MSIDPNDPDNPIPMTPIDPTPVDPVIPSDIPSDLQNQIDELNYEVSVLDAKDQISKLQTEIQTRTTLATPVPEWKRFKRVQRFWLKLKNADKWEKSDWATLLMLILGSVVVISQFAQGKVDVNTAIAINVGLGVVSQIGSSLSNKFGISNSIPGSAYTYNVNAIEAKTTVSKPSNAEGTLIVNNEDDSC